MSSFTPAQQTAIECLDTNMAVSAGAGAGKTKVLVQRYVNILLKERAICDEILAITFTNKAAKEMKERIRGEISTVLKGCSGAERERWKDIRYRLEFAAIGTIHSLCARILKENPVEVGIDPNFVVYDETQTQFLMQQATERVINTAAKKEEPWLGNLLQTYGREGFYHELAGLYEKLSSELETQDLLERLVAPYRQEIAKEEHIAEALIADCQELLNISSTLDKKSPHYQAVMAVSEHWKLILAAIENYYADIHNEEILSLYLGNLKARSKDKEIVKSIRKNMEALQGIKNEKLAIELIRDVLQYLQLLKQDLNNNKQQGFTFNELETATVKLLQNKAVCRQYCERFKYIMVDEVQDINDLQRQIIYLLCGGHPTTLLNHKLFIVGDPKQSIYRFRGADVDTFAKVTQDIINSGGREVSLTINFRSTDRLLTAFNDLFDPLMSTEYDKVKFSALQSYRQAVSEGCMQFIMINKQELTPEQGGREQEASQIAMRIKELVEEETLIIDRKPLIFGDIAILFRSTTDIEIYEAALQLAGIPYYVLGGRGFYEKQEITDLLNLLRFIDNCHNEVALVGILRSPLFLLSDESLFWLTYQGCSLWQGLSQDEMNNKISQEQKNIVQQAKTVLKRLLLLKGQLKVSQLLLLALEQTHYSSFLLTQFMGLQKFANVEKLIGIAKNYEKDEYGSTRDFLNYIESLIVVAAREGEAQIENETGNTVKLMTIHKSKGLEFPVVFIPDLHRKFPLASEALLYDHALGLGVKIRDVNEDWQKTNRYSVLAEKEKMLAALELKRLLYVAMTRAKDYLVLSAVGDKVHSHGFHEDTNWLEWLGNLCGFTVVGDIPSVVNLTNTQIPVYCPSSENRQRINNNLYEQYRQETFVPDENIVKRVFHNTTIIREQQPDGLKVFSPTALHKYQSCPRSFYYQYIYGLPLMDEINLVGTGKAPAVFVGIVVHKVCEFLVQGIGCEESLQKAIQQVPKQWQEKVFLESKALLEVYLTSEFYARQKEYPSLPEQKIHFRLTHPITKGVFEFQGIIDKLNFYEDGTIGIIDYKTDDLGKSSLRNKQAEYLWQMTLYQLGAQAVFKKPVRDITLYFLRAETELAIREADHVERISIDILNACQFITTHHHIEDYPCAKDHCRYCNYQLICDMD